MENARMSSEQVKQIIEDVHLASKGWKQESIEQRSKLLLRLASLLRSNQQVHAELITKEMGKKLDESKAEIEKCAKLCEYYAEEGAGFLAPVQIDTEATKSYVTFQPLGIVLGVMPWNFPFWQVFRFAVPAMLAGNACLLKHASNVSECAQEIENLFVAAGFPEKLFKTLFISSDEVASAIENPLVSAVTITGSTKAGKAVAEKAGSLLKKTVMELGGSDPYVILEDADLESAVKTCVKGRLLNAGQSCISAKRFIVVASIYDRFAELFFREMSAKTYGDPLGDADIGPMAREDLRDELHQQVIESIQKGAECSLGGKIPEEEGSYYPPTILENVQPGMPAYEQELFGPVAALIRAANEEEAIRIANDTVFGLGAAVFTKDIQRGEQIASTRLEAGCCFVNELVHSDPRLPFGGIKESGYGRELGPFGIREFVNAKSVLVK